MTLPVLAWIRGPGSHVAIGPEGDIYVSNFGGGDFVVQHSTDDGRSFTIPNHDTGQGIAFGMGFTTFADGNGLPTNHFRTNVVRAIAADPTRPGTVYAAEAGPGPRCPGQRDRLGRHRLRPFQRLRPDLADSFKVGPYTASVLNDDNHGQSATGSPTT